MTLAGDPTGSVFASNRSSAVGEVTSLSGFGGPAYVAIDTTNSVVSVGVHIGPETLVVGASSVYLPNGLPGLASDVESFVQGEAGSVQGALKQG
jgi:hypothetical protein